MTQNEKNNKSIKDTSPKRSVHKARSEKKPTVREPMSRDELRKQRQLERARKHRRNVILGYCAAAVIVIAIGIVLSLTVFFKTETIAVSGDEIYNNEQVITASGLKTGESMFLFKKEKVSQAIESALPYVDNAVIKRSPTGVVTVIITAAKATLAIDTGDSFVLLSASGKVLEDGIMEINDDIAIINASAVTLATPGQKAAFENANDADTIVAVEKLISENEIGGIDSIDVTDYSNIKLGYQQRITIELGSLISAESKMEFVKATLSKLDTDKPDFEGTVDFKIENKAYINPKEETTAAPAPIAPVQESVSVVE